MNVRYVIFGIIFSALGHECVADMYDDLQNVYASNPVIAQARAKVDAADADVNVAWGGARPYLGVMGGVGAARTEILGNDYDYSSTQFGAQFQQNVFQGGAILAQIKAAKALAASQRAVLYSTQQDVFLNAINAYISVLNSKEVLTLNKNNERVLHEYYDSVSNRADVGMLTNTDVAQASARLEMARAAVINAQTQYDNACETYRRIYGQMPKLLDDVSVAPVVDLMPDNPEMAEQYALGNHPALTALETQVVAARENITIARKTQMPSIDIKGSFVQFDDVPILDRVRDGRIGVYLSVPLYDKGVGFARADSARFTVAGIEQKIKDTRRTIIENVSIAWNAYQSSQASIAAATSAVRANDLALDGVRDGQERGRRTVLDVLNAEQELLNSRVSLVRAEHSRIAAVFAVLASMGRLTPENLGLINNDRDQN